MKIRTRILLALLLLAGLGVGVLYQWSTAELEPQYRMTTEEPLVDAARLMARMAGETVREGAIDVELFRSVYREIRKESFLASIYNHKKTTVDFRIYITDQNGIVLFDSQNGDAEGEDYSEWRDIKLTLKGEYGARTTRDIYENPDSSVMYVAAPIYHQEKIIGVLSLGNPTITANKFVTEAQQNLLFVAAIICLIIFLLAIWVSERVTQPIHQLTNYARDIRDGKRVNLPSLGSSEVRDLGEAFEEMRVALEGKEYVEKYVQTFSHEIKAPIAAIQGAAELLDEEMNPEQQQVFLRNIRAESKRIEGIVERLLLLASLEKQATLENPTEIKLRKLIEDQIQTFQFFLDEKDISIELDCDGELTIKGDCFLLEQAVMNLIQNAVEFSPQNSSIKIDVCKEDHQVSVRIHDQGPGIPDYAKDLIFDRFYSLQRPDTGRKSSGLGLSLVKEVAELHQGSIELTSSDSGTVAALTIPV